MQANEITTHLENILAGTSLIATHGKGYVDIKRKNLNKGFFLSHIIKEEFLEEIEPDLIMAIGDEESDEEMFKYLNYIENKFSYVKNETKIITLNHTDVKLPKMLFGTAQKKAPEGAKNFLVSLQKGCELALKQ